MVQRLQLAEPGSSAAHPEWRLSRIAAVRVVLVEVAVRPTAVTQVAARIEQVLAGGYGSFISSARWLSAPRVCNRTISVLRFICALCRALVRLPATLDLMRPVNRQRIHRFGIAQIQRCRSNILQSQHDPDGLQICSFI